MAAIKKIDEMVKPLTSQEKSSRQELVDSWNNVVNSARDKTFNIAQFGQLAIVKKKLHPIVFKRFADNEETIPKKELERAMKLVLEDSVDFRQAMKTAGKDVDIDANVDLLVIDSKMKDLTRESFSKFKKPSVAKLEKMKINLSQKDFTTVLKGNDKPYLDYLESVETKKVKVHNGEKPDGMDNDRFDTLFQGNKYALITLVDEYENSICGLDKQVKELELENQRLKGKLEAYTEIQTVRASVIPEEKNKKVA